ncbi:hypothetical protein JW826_05825 [Candidatus Woesearchaeota archaeon]|nr:hypothetical protein [Candidatus Woesearchaeota archaeon]
MGVLDLAWEDLKDKVKRPFAWMTGNLDRADVRITAREFIKGYEKDEKAISKHALELNTQVSLGSVKGVYDSMKALCDDSVKELDDEAKAILKLLLPVRREILAIIEMEKDETNPDFYKKESEDLVVFRKVLGNWFQTLEGINSFSIQMADRASRIAELKHILDIFNLQTAVKALSKDLRKVSKAEHRHDDKKEEAALKKMTADEAQVLKMLDTAFKDIIRLMQLTITENNAKLKAINGRLVQMKYPAKNQDEIKKLLKLTGSRYDGILKRLDDQLNGLINIARAEVKLKAA